MNRRADESVRIPGYNRIQSVTFRRGPLEGILEINDAQGVGLLQHFFIGRKNAQNVQALPHRLSRRLFSYEATAKCSKYR